MTEKRFDKLQKHRHIQRENFSFIKDDKKNSQCEENLSTSIKKFSFTKN